jgi:hypothetical protein
MQARVKASLWKSTLETPTVAPVPSTVMAALSAGLAVTVCVVPEVTMLGEMASAAICPEPFELAVRRHDKLLEAPGGLLRHGVHRVDAGDGEDVARLAGRR